MLTPRIVTLRIAIAALIWASALLAPAAAGQIVPNPGEPKNGVASIERATRASRSATALDAPTAGQTTYRYEAPDSVPPTPGPTDPNAPR